MTSPRDGGARRLVILGATGSVGQQALSVLGDLQLIGISADSSWSELLSLARAREVAHVQLADPLASRSAQQQLGSSGPAVHESVEALLDATQPDIVLNAIVGFAGLAASVAVLSRGIELALANKESLVAGGPLCMHLADLNDAAILPVDSEHSALMQCLAAAGGQEIESVVLTASGGPFRGFSRDQLETVTVEQALAHPTWNMGAKISIDSATLMNKGLELIEAQVLFDLAVDEVEVVVHPQSIVHAMVRYRDGSLLSHMAVPDMKVPIAYALHYPQRLQLASGGAGAGGVAALPDLTFEPADEQTFGCLPLAREAARAGGPAPCILNAANEVAVEAFLDRDISLLDIERVVEKTLQAADAAAVGYSHDLLDLAALQQIDERARAIAQSEIRSLRAVTR